MIDPKHREAVIAKLADSKKGDSVSYGLLKQLLEVAYNSGYRKACQDWKQEQVNEYWYPQG